MILNTFIYFNSFVNFDTFLIFLKIEPHYYS
jgi:hypothetical protein